MNQYFMVYEMTEKDGIHVTIIFSQNTQEDERIKQEIKEIMNHALQEQLQRKMNWRHV